MEIQSAFMGAAGATVLWLAALVRRRERGAWTLAACAFAFGAWSLARGATALGHAPSAGLEELAVTATAALGVVLVGNLLQDRATLRRFAPALVAIPAAAGALTAWPANLSPALVRGAAHASALGLLAIATVWLWRNSRVDTPPGSPGGADATRLRYVAIAQSGVLGAAVSDGVLAAVGVPVRLTLLVPLLYFYAVYLHVAQVRVGDLRQMMSKTVTLTLMASGMAAFFAAVHVWVGDHLDLFVFNAFVASFALLLCFEPAQTYIQNTMDRRFIAEKLALERVLAPLERELGQVLSLDELLPALLGTLENTDRVRSASIFLRDDASVGFQQVGSIGLQPRTRVSLIRHPAWVDAMAQSPALLWDELRRALDNARDEDERARLDVLCRTMHDLDAQLVLPLRTETHLLGFWTLAGPDDDEPFATDEVRLLGEIASQLAVSIDNSKTFERIRARDRFASLGEMAAGLAHEIRNPLATIRGALAVIDETEGDGDADLQNVIVEEIARLNRVVESFLDYARPDPHPQRISDLAGFTRACTRAVARERRHARVDLGVHVQDDLPDIAADPHQLERAVLNALQNAYDAVHDCGRVNVRVCAELDGEGNTPFVEIQVEDDGEGMDAETLERAFVPFFTTKTAGCGLGLALSERLMRAQGGSIALESEPGRGTRVRLRIPRWNEPAEDGAVEVSS